MKSIKIGKYGLVWWETNTAAYWLQPFPDTWKHGSGQLWKIRFAW